MCVFVCVVSKQLHNSYACITYTSVCVFGCLSVCIVCVTMFVVCGFVCFCVC